MGICPEAGTGQGKEQGPQEPKPTQEQEPAPKGRKK
jgi:hypothetical protein